MLSVPFAWSRVIIGCLLCINLSHSFITPRIVTGVSVSVSTTTNTETKNAASSSSSSLSYVELTVGDTKGAALMLENIAVARGSNRLLGDINWSVQRNERWGIVGPNGVGKSTLLGAITGTVQMEEGKAIVAPKVKVGYLKQTAVSGSIKTVAEEAASEMIEINEAAAKCRAAEKAIEEGDISDKALAALDSANEQFSAVGGYTQEAMVETVLKGLGFKGSDMQQLCSDFSGGWQMRIALARLLLSKPSLLLLDEPSNHLDSSAREWLGNYLSNYDGSIILVSHDIGLLEQSVNSIAEINGGTLLTYVGCSYQKYVDEREFRAKSALAEYERNVEEAARLQAFVDKFGASATKASSAQSRVKMIEKMKKEGKLTPPPVAVTVERRKPVLMLPNPPKAIGDDLIILKAANIGWESNKPPIVNNIECTIQRGMKIILRGPNGAGKSTLMAALRNKIQLLSGTKELNRKLRLGVFTQDLAQELDTSKRAVDLVTAYARDGEYGDINVSDQDARSVMGMLNLGGDKPLRKVGDLSGGEKARVALSMFALKASNLLLLDEPSNHLDVECIDCLGEALSTWGDKEGAIVVISHDRSFCEKIGFTHVGTVKDGSFTLEERPLNKRDWEIYDLESQGANERDPSEVSSGSWVPQISKEEDARLRKLAYNAPKRIKKLEAMIEKCEEQIEQIDVDMVKYGTDFDKLKDLMNSKGKEETKLEKYMTEWEELDLILAQSSK